MTDQPTNYSQGWADETVRRFRSAWNGSLDFARFPELFQSSLRFHFHDTEVQGIAGFQAFIVAARDAAVDLDLHEEIVLARDDKVLLYYRWSSRRWHPDVIGANALSNYCKVVLRIEAGRIAEVWQQAPDFLYLLGKRPIAGPMHYPEVVREPLLAKVDGGIFPTDDPETILMSKLFKGMNDCFLNRASLRDMQRIHNEDIVYDTGHTRGSGVASWKTFAYALHTCLGNKKGTRFDDLYIRDGSSLQVFLRATLDEPSPYVLRCADGLIAAMKLEIRGDKIQALRTQIENYIQFLDTDFTRHDQRLKGLFQGRPEPVAEAVERLAGMPQEPGAPHAPEARGTTVQEPGPFSAETCGVAIVGIAGRFPQCDSVAGLWQALAAGRSLISEAPPQRAGLRDQTAIRHAGFIGDIEPFDAPFFQLLPAEAEFVDPQQRLLLQEIVHSIEDSGHRSADYAGPRTGLFVASLCEDYQKLLAGRGLLGTPQTWAGTENAMFPARVARFFDIQGPCHFVNAECASSLVALHEASRLIREGAIDQAIVGASNLLLHPYGFAVRQGTLLTDEPVARLFGKDSRGQLRGEAVVSVILKSLPKAINDGDRIYGTIAGSAINNSGKTFSLVAGNVQQQARVMVEAWRQAGVGPADISLIECHSSGVRGGDFAELAAIRQAFGASSDRAGPASICRLTTAKAATGHAEAASGLGALIKVVLQLQHRCILGIHGLEEPDPELPIDPERFELARTTGTWDAAPFDAALGSRPRRAGINAFAAGGYNAHVVIEEFVPGTNAERAPRSAIGSPGGPQGAHPHVVVVSAQSETSLRSRLDDLRRHLQAGPAIDVADLAYTLHRRDDELKHRAAFVVATADALPMLIDAVLSGRALPPDAHIGKRERVAGTPALESPADAPTDWRHLAARWVAGQAVDWGRIVPRAGRRLLTDLPAYPFDCKRYGLPGGIAAASSASAGLQRLHPLLHQNVSTLSQQRYRSVFSGDEPLLADHVVQGRKVLPGVAYLEMVRAAVADALAAEVPLSFANEGSICLRLANVVWLQPIAIEPGGGPLEVFVELSSIAEPDRESGVESAEPLTRFEVCTVFEGQRRLHCQGQARIETRPAPAAVDLAALRSACAETPLTAAQTYATYRAMGIDYGPSYRAVTSLHSAVADDGVRREVIAMLMPHGEVNDGCVLRPSVLDAAVHAAIGLADFASSQDAPRKPPLPFAVESVEVFRSSRTVVAAWIRHSSRNDDASGSAVSVQKLDIDLLDDAGAVCLRLGRFSSRTGDRAPAVPVAVPKLLRLEPALELDLTRLQHRVLASLKEKVAGILQVAADAVDPNEDLSEYGFDSINLTEFGKPAERGFLPATAARVEPDDFLRVPDAAGFQPLSGPRASRRHRCQLWLERADRSGGRRSGASARRIPRDRRVRSGGACGTGINGPADAVDRRRHRDRRHQRSLPDGRRSRCVLAEPARWARLHHRSARRPLGLARALRQPCEGAEQDRRQMGWLRRRHRRLRPALLRHLAARGRVDGSPAPHAAAARVAGDRRRRARPARSRRQPYRRFPRNGQQRLQRSADAGEASGRGFDHHRHGAVGRPQSHQLPARSARSERTDRDRLLVVAGGDPSRRQRHPGRSL